MLVAATAAACDVKLPEKIDFAVAEKIVEIGDEGGDATTMVFTDATVTVALDKTVEWCAMTSPSSFSTDSPVTVSFDPNGGLRRSVVAALSYKDGMVLDSICFRQEGIKAVLALEEHTAFMDSRSAAALSVGLDTNIPKDEISVEIEYVGDAEGWIENIEIGDGALLVHRKDISFDKTHKAMVTLSHTDGWGEELVEVISVNISDKNGLYGSFIDFVKLHEIATADGYLSDDDMILSGLIVSDCSSKNMEMNPNTAFNTVDTTPSDVTAYMESEDGRYGVKLVFKNASDNTLKQLDRVNLYLNGCTILKEENPERYTISGVVASGLQILEPAGTMPIKSRKISELTDDDIHTFVEIPETEFLDKDGCYSNVYDSFTLKSDFNTTSVSTKMNSDCWPAMLISSEGRSIYAIVNMMCPWRRTGGGVPQGIGTLKGIVVHNVHPRYGDMGRYQIRVVDQKGYAQKSTTGSSFSIYAKWDGSKHKYNFTNYGSFFPYSTTSGGMDSVVPSEDFDKSTGAHNGELSFENKMGEAMSGTKAIRPCRSYSAKKMSTNGGQLDSRGLSIQCDIAGWYNWDDKGSASSFNGIVADFSTADMSGKRVFLAFGFCCGGNDNIAFKNFPAHWCVEYSTDGGNNYTIVNSIDGEKPYVHLRSFPFGGPVTIEGRVYYPSYSTGMGYTEHFFEFPSDITGKENVKVRIRPYDDVVTVIPEDPAADIETAKARSGMSIYQDLRFNRIVILTR